MPGPLLANALTEQPPAVLGLMVVGVLLVSLSMLMGLRNRKRRAGQQVTAREHLERLKQKQGLRDDLETIAVEIEEMARRLGSQLDGQAARLEALLRQAEHRIARLEALQESMLNGGARPMPPDAPDVKPTPQDASHHAPPTSGGGGGERLAHDVGKLADAGHSAAEIARALDQPVGKVELILALRRAAPPPTT